MTGTSPTRPLACFGGEPLFDEPLYVTQPVIPDEDHYQSLAREVFDSRWLTNDGRHVRNLEAELQRFLDVPFCASTCNGTIALLIALRSLDLSGEVITTPFTFPATVHAIAWNGLTPVFCDIDPDTYAIDPSRIAPLITDSTSAILPVHIFGNPCDVLGIQELADRHDLNVVYDAAHAFGVRHKGKSIGRWGDLSILSFHATKMFHTGEGGAIIGPDRERFESLALLRNLGIVNQEVVKGVGINGKLSELHAIVGLTLLGRLEKDIERRRALVARYRERCLGISGIRLQRLVADTETVPSHFSIEIVPDEFGLTRDEVHQALLSENVVTRRYFFPLCSENEAYRNLESASPERLPNAHRVASRILCMPLFSTLRDDQVDSICDCLEAIHSQAPSVRRACAPS